MERYAYYYALQNKCIEKRDTLRVAMPELFDMIAGSETGAIIGSSLVVPASDSKSLGRYNEHFAESSVDFFQNNAKILYVE